MASLQAEELKAQANDLFKKSDFKAASLLYGKAYKLDAKPVYLSNWSAALFELGRYTHCVQKCDELLALPGVEASLSTKVRARKTKALLYDMRLEEAASTAKSMLEEDASNAFAEETFTACEGLSSGQPGAAHRIMQVPRYRPAYETRREYYTIGHDDSVSVLGPQPSKRRSKEDAAFDFVFPSAKETPIYEFSALFVGIGDARNLLASLAELGHKLKTAEKNAKKSPLPQLKMHFTLNDINAAVLARDLIIFTALRELASFTQEQEKSKRAMDLKMLSFYVFWCRIMPPKVEKLLQEVIAKLVKTLDIPVEQSYSNDWIFIQAKTVPRVRDALVWWQTNPQPVTFDAMQRGAGRHQKKAKDVGLSQQLGVSNLMQSADDKKRTETLNWLKTTGATTAESHAKTKGITVAQAREDLTDRIMDQGDVPQEIVFEDHLLQTYQLPPKEAEEPDELEYVWDIIRAPEHRKVAARAKKPNSPSPDELYDKHIRPRWKVNCTLVSSHWTPDHSNLQPFASLIMLVPPNSFVFAQVQQSKKSQQANMTSFEYVSVFFSLAVDGIRRALKRGKGSLMVEMESGEGMAMMQGIATKTISRQPGFPQRYNRVHLSNVPDYTGGYLSSFSLGATLLKTIPNAYLTQCNLMNCSVWEGFQEKDYAKCKDSELYHYAAATQAELPSLYGVKLATHPDFPGCYHSFARVPSNEQQLSSRVRLTEMVYDVFARLVMPNKYYEQPRHQQLEVRNPENVHSFFRSLAHLKVVGVPAHFLAQLCANILANKIHTAPLHAVAPAPLKHQNQIRVKFDTSPFLMEFQIAVALWEPRLFPVASTSGPEVSIGTLQHYSILLPLQTPSPMFPGLASTLILVFGLPADLNKGIIDLRSGLTKERKTSIQIVSTFDREGDRITFLLDKVKATKVIAEGCEVVVSSIYKYRYLSDCVSLKAMEVVGDADNVDGTVRLSKAKAMSRSSPSQLCDSSAMGMPNMLSMFEQMMSSQGMGL